LKRVTDLLECPVLANLLNAVSNRFASFKPSLHLTKHCGPDPKKQEMLVAKPILQIHEGGPNPKKQEMPVDKPIKKILEGGPDPKKQEMPVDKPI
jgi:hypothetical protein